MYLLTFSQRYWDPKCDKHVTSSYNVHSLSRKQVMRKKKKKIPAEKETVCRISRFDCFLFLCELLVKNIEDLPICVHILGLQISSSILGSDEFLISHLSRFLEPVAGAYSRWSLCWRGSSYGWSSGKFYSYCNGKSKTVTLIRKDQYVFGGYADQPWGKNVITDYK